MTFVVVLWFRNPILCTFTHPFATNFLSLDIVLPLLGVTLLLTNRHRDPTSHTSSGLRSVGARPQIEVSRYYIVSVHSVLYYKLLVMEIHDGTRASSSTLLFILKIIKNKI